MSGFIDGVGELLNPVFQRGSEAFGDVANQIQEVAMNNSDNFITGNQRVELATGEYESNRLDPITRYNLDLRDRHGIFSKLYEDGVSKIYAYPMDLSDTPSTTEAMHFMQFNMYEVESPSMRNRDNLSQLLQELEADPETDNFMDSVDTETLNRMGLAGGAYENVQNYVENNQRQDAVGYGTVLRSSGYDSNLGPIAPNQSGQRRSTDQLIQLRLDDVKTKIEKDKTVRSPNPTRTLRQKRYKSKDTCFLYMPHKINNLSLQSYDTPSMLFANMMIGIGGDVTRAAQQAIGQGNLKAAGNSIADALSKAGPVAMRKALGFIDSVSSIIGMDTELEAAATQIFGASINPRKELVYNAPELRTFEFSYEFYPRSVKETQIVESIIRLFRFHSAPTLANSGVFLIPPSIFAIKFFQRTTKSVAENPFLLKVRDCALTEVNVDFTPNGSFSAHMDGSPVAITMSLTFKELDVNVKDDILEGY